MMPTTPRELAAHLHAVLDQAGIPAADTEAEWLVAASLGVSRTELYVWESPLAPEALETIQHRLWRRLAGEPLPYCIGEAEFCGHRLTVSPAVLIPRPETEVLVEEAIRRLRTLRADTLADLPVLEVGTGSGGIAISLAKAVPTCVLIAVELSWTALLTAAANAGVHRVAHRIQLVQTDWTSGVRGPCSLIVANPPYVPTDDVERMLAGGGREPRLSLDGGPDGMQWHRRLLEDAPRLLAPGGALGMECAEDQAQRLAVLARSQPWAARTQVYHDLTGRPRGLWIDRR